MIGNQFVQEVINKNVEIVGAVDGYDKIIGKDLGEHIGLEKMNILIEKDLEKVIKKSKPELVVICSKTNILDIADDIKTCIVNKVDVLTASEHCYFWELVAPEIGHKIDNLAKEYGVTVCSSGVQDMNWNVIPYALTVMSHKVERIDGKTLVMIDDMHEELTTTSCMINRIPDILNANSGFITINELPVPYYRQLPLNDYIK